MTMSAGHDWDMAHQEDDANKEDDYSNDKLTHLQYYGKIL